ncbi:hypothetical protein JW962_03645 [Candidatus Dojkabacteria bacterium]|nr:hypothetical protein [Candidatus Dojkabacteria bacterium]
MDLKSIFSKKPQKKLPFKRDFSIGHIIYKLCSDLRANKFLTDYSFILAAPLFLITTLYTFAISTAYNPGQIEKIPFWLLTKESNNLLESINAVKFVPWGFAIGSFSVILICTHLFKYSKHLTRFVVISTAISLSLFSLGFVNLVNLVS